MLLAFSVQLCFTSPIQSFDANSCHSSCLPHLSALTSFSIIRLNSSLSQIFDTFYCTASCVAVYYSNTMVTSTQPMVKPQSSINGHTHMFNACVIESSLVYPTKVQQRSQSPSSHHDTRRPTTPAPSIPSTPQEVGSNCDPCLHYNVPDCKSELILYYEVFYTVKCVPMGKTHLRRYFLAFRSQCIKLRLTPRQTLDNTTCPGPLVTPRSNTVKDSLYVRTSPSASSSPSSGLKLKLRGIQAALKEPTDNPCPNPESFSTRKRSSLQTYLDEDFDTDSEIDLMPFTKIVIEPTAKRSTACTASRKIKKIKATHNDRDYEDDDAIFDAGDEDSSPTSPVGKFTLSTNILKRSERILDPTNPDHAKLIAAAPKAGLRFVVQQYFGLNLRCHWHEV